MIILHFHLQPQLKYELFHILHIKNTTVVFFCERVYLTRLTDRRDNFYDTAALKSTVLISVVNYCICKRHRN